MHKLFDPYKSGYTDVSMMPFDSVARDNDCTENTMKLEVLRSS